MFTRGQRGAVLGLLVTLLAGVVGLVPAHAAAAFNPVITIDRGTDAARAATSFSLTITQNDGEDQIGPLQLDLQRGPGFTLDTRTGTSGTQVGTLHIVLFSDPRPGTVTLDGTLLDDNSRSGCTAGVRQCLIAHIQDVPGYGSVNAQLEIDESVAGVYRIVADLTDTWTNPAVQAIHAGLKELTANLYASVGTHTIVTNPLTAGSWSFNYKFTSLTAQTKAGTLPLATFEYPPSAPVQWSPMTDSVHLSNRDIDFGWAESVDPNNDEVTYGLTIDGAPVSLATATHSGGYMHLLQSVPAGAHTWQVTATANGDTVTSPPATFTTIDPNATLNFTSPTNGDKLWVDTARKAFVYEQANVLFGAFAPSITPDHGYIAVTKSNLTVAIAYAATPRSAAGTFIYGNARRVFFDSPLD